MKECTYVELTRAKSTVRLVMFPSVQLNLGSVQLAEFQVTMVKVYKEAVLRRFL